VRAAGVCSASIGRTSVRIVAIERFVGTAGSRIAKVDAARVLIVAGELAGADTLALEIARIHLGTSVAVIASAAGRGFVDTCTGLRVANTVTAGIVEQATVERLVDTAAGDAAAVDRARILVVTRNRLVNATGLTVAMVRRARVAIVAVGRARISGHADAG